jgi:hypothetical protein
VLLHLRVGGSGVESLHPICIGLGIFQKGLREARAVRINPKELPGQLSGNGQEVGTAGDEVTGVRRQ